MVMSERELKKDPDAGEKLKGKFSSLSGLRVGGDTH